MTGEAQDNELLIRDISTRVFELIINASATFTYLGSCVVGPFEMELVQVLK